MATNVINFSGGQGQSGGNTSQGQTALPNGAKAIVKTSSGKTYTLSEDQFNWVRDRYKQDWAGSYGYDDADRQAEAAGQMSAKVRNTYKRNNVDNALMGLGLPSEKNLDKYLGAYDQWHTGGIKDVIGNNVSQDAMDWVGNRYRQSWTYEDTDEDQQRKAQGLMPSAMLSRYGDTELDEDLMQNGLPSSKDLNKYLEGYGSWHTGKMSDVFGQDLPDDYWQKTKDFYRSDWEYENTPEDQERKKQGLMPTKLLKEYGDTEIDEELLARGLPSMKSISKYVGRYNDASSINALYANAAFAQTRLRADGIKNDNQRYTIGDETHSGQEWYAKAFFDELERTDEAGNRVYGSIMPLFKNNHVVPGEAGIDPTKDYVTERGKLITAEGKAEALAEDYANGKAFSYDDFMGKADGYYDRYVKDVQLENGQTVDEYLKVLERDADEEAVRDLYDIDDSIFGKKGVQEFITRYYTDYPSATPKQMFDDMYTHGVDEKLIQKTMKAMQRSTTKNEDFYGISNDFVKAKQEAAARAEAKLPETFNIGDTVGEGAPVTEPEPQEAGPSTKAVRKALTQYKAAEESRSQAYEFNPSAKSAADRQYQKAKANLTALGFDDAATAQAWLDENEGKKAEPTPTYTDAVAMAQSYLNDHGEWTPENMSAAFEYLREQGVPEDAVQQAAESMQMHYGNLPTGSQSTESIFTTPDSVTRKIADFANTHGDTRRGEWTEAQANALFKELEDGGARPSAIRQAIEDDASLWQLSEYYDKRYHGADESNPARWEDEQSADLKAYTEAAKKADGEDESTIEETRYAIQNGLSRLIDNSDETGKPVDLDSVLSVIDSVRGSNYTNPTAMQRALEDLGFFSWSGFADDLTANWSEDDRTRLYVALGNNQTVEVPEEDRISDIDRIVTDTIGEEWAGQHFVPSQKILNRDNFNYALQWAQEKIATGDLTAGEAFNILAANGYQDEMETYMPDEWHEAHFKENLAPTLWAQSSPENAMLWEDMTPEEKDAVTSQMWANLTDEQKASIYSNPNWWKQDPTVYRTFGQALEQQFQAVLPGFAANLISAPVIAADAIDAAITGRPEMKESTEKWRSLERGLGQYGYVEDNVNGAKVAQVASDVTQELLRMQTLGTVGGTVGTVMGGTAAGAALAKAASGNIPVVKQVANMFLRTVQASPFVVSAFAGNYADAKELGASNSEATWFGTITGLTEGILESFEFDELWGKAIGQEGFAKQLLAGKTNYLQRFGIMAKARLASMGVSGLGELTEESIGYGVETFLKMRHDDTWGKGTEWSASDWFEQAMMGFITGAVGGGISGGSSINAYGLVSDYMQSDDPMFRQAFPDNYTAISIAESLPDGVVETYRKGGASIMSVDAYKGVVAQIANCDTGIENAAKVLEQAKTAAQSKLDSKLLEIEKNRAKAAGIDVTNTEALGQFANLCNKLGIKVDFAAGDIAGQVQAALDAQAGEAQAVYDTTVADAEAACKARQQEAQNQKASLQKQIQEHYVGLYLLNHDGIVNGLNDEVATNTAMAWQNGAKYDPTKLSEQAAAGVNPIRGAVGNAAVEGQQGAAPVRPQAPVQQAAQQVAQAPVAQAQTNQQAVAEQQAAQVQEAPAQTEQAPVAQQAEAQVTQQAETAPVAEQAPAAQTVHTTERTTQREPAPARPARRYGVVDSTNGQSQSRSFEGGRTPRGMANLAYKVDNAATFAKSLQSGPAADYAGFGGVSYSGSMSDDSYGYSKTTWRQDAAGRAIKDSQSFVSGNSELGRGNNFVDSVVRANFLNSDELGNAASMAEADVVDRAPVEIDPNAVLTNTQRGALKGVANYLARGRQIVVQLPASDGATFDAQARAALKTIFDAVPANKRTGISFATGLTTNDIAQNAGDVSLVITNDAQTKTDGDSHRWVNLDSASVQTQQAGTTVQEAANPVQEAQTTQTATEAETTAQPAPAEPTQATGRTLTDEEVSGVQQAAKDIHFNGEVNFIDDPNAEDAWIDGNGNITINRANISESEAKELSTNPAWWLMKHELTHFAEGTPEYEAYSQAVQGILKAQLGENYDRVLDEIRNDYAQRGINLDDTGVLRELVAKFSQSGRILNDAETINTFVREQGSFADRIYNWIRYKIDDLKLRRKPNSQLARDMLKAERLYAQAYRAANRRPARDSGVNGRQYAIKRTTSNRPFVEIDEDILNGVPQDQWQKTVAAEIKRRFKGGFDVNGQHFDVSTRSANELTRSRDTENAKRTDQSIYADKLRTASNIDEITEASTDYVNEELHHNRKGNIESFGRGQVLFRIGGRDYRAEVLVGNRADGSMLFYDVVKVTPTSFTEKESKQSPVMGDNSAGAISLGTASKNSIPSEAESVNGQNRTLSTGQSLDDLIQKYGAIEQGRNPRERDVQLPNQVSDERYVSKFARSVSESNKANDEIVSEIESDLSGGVKELLNKWSYIRKSNDSTMKLARDFIAEKGWLGAKDEFHRLVNAENYSLKTEAFGLQLLADAADRGDWVSVKELIPDLRVLATDAGQRTQLFNVLKDLKGAGSAWYLEALVDRLNAAYYEDIKTGKANNGNPITISDAVMEQARNAKTQEEVDAAEDAAARELAGQLPLKFTDKMTNWRYLSMLGNPVTHIRNVTGNNLMYGMGSIKDLVATIIERGAEKVGLSSESDRTTAALSASDRAYWKDFVQKSYNEQKSNLQSGGGKRGMDSRISQVMRSFDNKFLNTIAQGKDPGEMSTKKGIRGLFENIRNNGAMGMLEVEDAWGLERQYTKSLTEYMKAQGYELKNGKVGKTDANGNFTEISNEDMLKAVDWATNQAWTATFRGPSQLATMLNKIAKMNGASKVIVEGVMPFKKTPINIAKAGFMYSPGGIIVGTTELLTKVKQGKMSAAQAIDHMASGLTGTALFALGAVLAKAGIIRAGGEKDKKLEGFLEDTGDQTYAFKFGNTSINMSAIAPATIPLFMGVALQEAVSQNGGDLDLSTITDTIAGTLNPFMEMSFMSSVNSALKNYNNNGIGGALGSTLMTAAQNYGSQFLPTIGGKVAQFIDPTQRTTKSDITNPLGSNLDYYGRSLAKKVPGLEATLQPDVDVWGRTNTKDSFGDWLLDFANKFVLPTNVKVTNRDAVDNELIRVVESTGVTDFLPSDGSKYFTVKGKRLEMNAKQYTEYSQERGTAAYVAIKDVMSSAAYQNATDEQRADMLKKAKEGAYKQVNNAWKEKLGAYDIG